MPISPYLRSLRQHVGTARILLPAITAVVRDAAGAVLLVLDRDTGVWTTPGGAIDPDETPADAVVRETWEETGFFVEPMRVLGVYGGPDFVIRYPNGDEAQYVMIVFECSVRGGAARADGVETTDVRFWSAADAATIALAPWLRPMVDDIFVPPAEPRFRAASWTPDER